jgi:hypothetical protein
MSIVLVGGCISIVLFDAKLVGTSVFVLAATWFFVLYLWEITRG